MGSLTNSNGNKASGPGSGSAELSHLDLPGKEQRCALLGRDKERLLETGSDSHRWFSKVTVVSGGTFFEQDLSCLIQRLEQEVEHIDVLVHAAGAIVLGDMNSSDDGR